MILDGHIHTWKAKGEKDDLSRSLAQAGIDGGLIISLAPACFAQHRQDRMSPAERVDDAMAWCADSETLYPFFWIDPTELDALDQVALAIDRGIKGFKVICDNFYPGDERAMKTYAAIADANRPILFHSGILWDGKASSPYNRPAEFERLLEIDGLRFSLAHISWPWCDELIAVYGKMLHAHGQKRERPIEMFIDITPGTPVIYRRDALTKLFTVGYDIEHNVIFGTDSNTNNYNAQWARQWIDRDTEIYQDLGLGHQTVDAIFGGNLERFVEGTIIEKQGLRPGE